MPESTSIDSRDSTNHPLRARPTYAFFSLYKARRTTIEANSKGKKKERDANSNGDRAVPRFWVNQGITDHLVHTNFPFLQLFGFLSFRPRQPPVRDRSPIDLADQFSSTDPSIDRSSDVVNPRQIVFVVSLVAATGGSRTLHDFG